LQLLILACVAFLGIQIIYLSLFLYAFLNKKTFPGQPPQPVSVIICAHDEEANLRELIPLLLLQDHPEFEIIIVEDRGNDGTYDYLLSATKEKEHLKMVRVVYLPEHITGKKFALTLGIKAAKYDWVLLTDADCRPDSNRWLEYMSGRFNGTCQIVLGFSAYEKRPGLLNSFIRFETFLTGIQYIGMARVGLPYMGVGRNLAYRKSLFLDNKGFNTHLGLAGGDDDLFVNEHARKRNTTTAIGKGALVYSKPKTTWREFYYQKLRHLFAGKRYKLSTKLVLGLFSISWIAVWILAVPVAFFAPEGGWLAGLIVFRWVVMALLFYDAPRKLGDGFEAWKVPLMDFIYAFYYLVAGLTALISKKVRWRV